MKKLLISTLLSATILASGTAFADDMKRAPMPKHMQEAISTLPQDKQELVKKSMQEGREANKASFEQMRALRKEINEILTAEKFDKDAFLSKSKALEALQDKMAANRMERIADLASQLTQEERKAVFPAMMKRHMYMKKHKDMGKEMGKDSMKGDMPPAMEHDDQPEQE